MTARSRLRLFSLFILACLSIALPVKGEAPPTIDASALLGTWSINAANFPGKLDFSLDRNQVKGRIWFDVLNRWEDLQDIRFDGKTLTFTHPYPGAIQHYSGRYSANAVQGSFDENGQPRGEWHGRLAAPTTPPAGAPTAGPGTPSGPDLGRNNGTKPATPGPSAASFRELVDLHATFQSGVEQAPAVAETTLPAGEGTLRVSIRHKPYRGMVYRGREDDPVQVQYHTGAGWERYLPWGYAISSAMPVLGNEENLVPRPWRKGEEAVGTWIMKIKPVRPIRVRFAAFQHFDRYGSPVLFPGETWVRVEYKEGVK